MQSANLGAPAKGMPIAAPVVDAANTPVPQGERVSAKRKLWNAGAKVLVWAQALPRRFFCC